MTRQTIVLKFGGSSQCEKGMPTLLNAIKQHIENNNKIILVISAIQKTTNMLHDIVFGNGNVSGVYELHKDFCHVMKLDFDKLQPIFMELFNDINLLKLCEEEVDQLQYKIKIISYGELLSSTCVHQYLKLNGIDNTLIDAHKFIINRSHSSSIDKNTLNIRGEFYFDNDNFTNLSGNKQLVITQGYVASTADNGYCILTRSGSNTSAALIATGINANRLEIFTDVNGLYTADPRKISNAKTIRNISYDMCQEAATMGSQVIHPFSIKPCQYANIPIHIKNTFNPSESGTIISNTKCDDIYVIANQKDVTLFKVKSFDVSDMWEVGIASDIFNRFNENSINIDIITTSQFSVSTTSNEKSQEKVSNVTNSLITKYDVNVISNCNTVSIVANNNKCILQKTHVAIIDKFKHPIHMYHYGDNNLSLSFVIDNNASDELISLLHGELYDSIK